MSDLTQVRRGQVWCNRHTGRLTTVLSVESVRRPEPHALAQASDGELLFGDWRPMDRVRVFHTANVPPDFRSGGGDTFDSFVEHWRLDDSEKEAIRDEWSRRLDSEKEGDRR